LGKVVRLLFPAVLVLAAYYAVFGGEYSVFELRRIRAELQEARVQLDELKAENDSLRIWADSLESDIYTIERLAREQGLLLPQEEMIRFERPAAGDTTGGGG
jgi:cell division protein FtsB